MCKICKRDCDTVFCENCLKHLVQLSPNELKASGCQIREELTFSDNKLVKIDRYISPPIPIDHINLTLDIVGEPDNGEHN